MNAYIKNPKTFGIAFKVWHEYLTELFQSKKVPLNLEHSVLVDLYHADCSPLETYYMARTRTVRSALIHVIWFDAYGQESIQLTNNESIRHFYQQNPDIKHTMDFKS